MGNTICSYLNTQQGGYVRITSLIIIIIIIIITTVHMEINLCTKITEVGRDNVINVHWPCSDGRLKVYPNRLNFYDQRRRSCK